MTDARIEKEISWMENNGIDAAKEYLRYLWKRHPRIAGEIVARISNAMINENGEQSRIIVEMARDRAKPKKLEWRADISKPPKAAPPKRRKQWQTFRGGTLVDDGE